jgi:hypothetical protein
MPVKNHYHQTRPLNPIQPWQLLQPTSTIMTGMTPPEQHKLLQQLTAAPILQQLL